MNSDNRVVSPKFNAGDVVVALNSVTNLLTQGKEYIVGNMAYNGQLPLVETDDGNTNEMYAWRFKLKEEETVNEIEQKQYLELSTGLVYDSVFEGETVNVLKAAGREISVHISNLKAPHLFVPYTKQMQKQQKKNEDLITLSSVTDEIRKLLDDNHVICHANVNRDTKGLVEFNIMLGESV